MVALSVGLAAAQGGGPEKKGEKPSKDAPPVHAPRFASPGRPQGPVSRGPGPHMGDWFRRNETLPPDQQLKKLEQNPDFQHLPPDRQQRLRDRLQNFISLPPEQKDRILHRMETYERLSPEQQQRVHDLFRQYRGLPTGSSSGTQACVPAVGRHDPGRKAEDAGFPRVPQQLQRSGARPAARHEHHRHHPRPTRTASAALGFRSNIASPALWSNLSMRKRGLAVLLLFASATAVAQDLAHGQEIAQQKCDTCHTLRDEKKQPIVGLLAGGKLIGGAASANLTPDASGISYYDDKLFLQVLRTGGSALAS